MRYIATADVCRSQYIASYFGDGDTKECGVCDNCLAKKRKALSNEEFDLRSKNKYSIHFPSNSILYSTSLKKFNKEKSWSVLDHLQSEQLISIDEQELVQKFR
jgi:ATP-dependent DNA helicase RecQ